MENFRIGYHLLLEIFGFITAVGVGISWLLKLFSPLKKLKEEMEVHSKNLDEYKKTINYVTNVLQKMERQQRSLGFGLVSLMNSLISDNDKEELKKQRNKILGEITGGSDE